MYRIKFNHKWKRKKKMNLGENAAPVMLMPRCQYCGIDPARIVPAFANLADGRLATFMCANPDCRAIHSVQLIGMLQQPQQEQSRIVVPN